MTATTPRTRKSKGAKFQKDIARKLADTYNLSFEQDGDIYGRQMGGAGVDIVMSEQAKQLIPFDIEAKRTERLQIPKWWKQTKVNTENSRIPLLVLQQNRQDILAVLKFDDLIKLVINNDIHTKRSNE